MIADSIIDKEWRAPRTGESFPLGWHVLFFGDTDTWEVIEHDNGFAHYRVKNLRTGRKLEFLARHIWRVSCNPPAKQEAADG